MDHSVCSGEHYIQLRSSVSKKKITQLTKDDAVSSSYQPTEESRKFKVHPTSGRFVTGPLLGCKAPVLCDVGLADANSDKSLRWPSSNSDAAP